MLLRTRIGTCTWNYPGWRGIVYPPNQAEKTSSAERLRSYATSGRFETVEADFTFYRPQSAQGWKRYASGLPKGFPVVSKVWEELTVEVFPNVERQKERAGKANPNFLNPEAFKSRVLKPAEEGFGDHVGPFVFEFRRDWNPTRENGKRFIEALDHFLRALPGGHRYATEIRTPAYLTADYIAMLKHHNVAHVLNWWTYMPGLKEQFELPGVRTMAFWIARVLVAPGRKYPDAVKFFSPYDRIKEPHAEMRTEAATIARTAEKEGVDFFLLINNRAEGCAPITIEEIRKDIIS